MTDFPSEADEVELWDLLCLISQGGVEYHHATGGCHEGHPGSPLPGDTFYKPLLLTGFDQQMLALHL